MKLAIATSAILLQNTFRQDDVAAQDHNNREHRRRQQQQQQQQQQLKRLLDIFKPKRIFKSKSNNKVPFQFTGHIHSRSLSDSQTILINETSSHNTILNDQAIRQPWNDTSVVECVPRIRSKVESSSADVGILECGSIQYCMETSHSLLGGICVDVIYNEDNKDQQRDARNLQSFTSFYDFAVYACSYMEFCECEDNDDSLKLTCNYEPECVNNYTVCQKDDNTFDLCSVVKIDAYFETYGNYNFTQCLGYISPFEFIYCHQIIAQDYALDCLMNVNGNECQQCSVDFHTLCTEFDCSNTDSQHAGKMCNNDKVLTNVHFVEHFNCSEACNICGTGEEVTNYNYRIGSLLGSQAQCYYSYLCEIPETTCADAQTVGFMGGLAGSDSCKVAPDVDIYPQCCTNMTIEPSVSLPPAQSPTIDIDLQCKDLHHSCNSCIESGCFWCPEDALCSSSPNFVDPDEFFGEYFSREHSCKVPENYTTDTCIENDVFFSDPLYAAQKWIFDMINLIPVWEKGYTGKGVRVRVNDDGIESSHPEFQDRIDFSASCPGEVEPLQSTYEEGFSHGTAVASILGATGGNNMCSVGVAPEVTFSACSILSSRGLKSMLLYNMDKIDISTNSWGVDGCLEIIELERQLEEVECPFTYEESIAFPCRYCDFSAPERGQCLDSVNLHCQLYFREDTYGCLEMLDLVLGGNCKFHGLSDEHREAFSKGVTQGRQGKGIIFIYSAGNSIHKGDDTNLGGIGENTRTTIPVSAIGKDGKIAYYSTPGASVFVSAPGGSTVLSVSNIMTAALNGECTDAGEGTSFATPVVSGVVALMLEANPDLTWRDVQAIVAKTSQRVEDESDESAAVNGAGFWHSNFYGFGIINALAAVEAAEEWELLENEIMWTEGSGTLNQIIPDDATKSVTHTLDISPDGQFATESVYIYVRLDHSSRGHLQISLISPSGMKSVLSPGRLPENTQLEKEEWWKMTTVRHWGESPIGSWTLSIVDLKEGDVEGTCASYDWAFQDFLYCSFLEELQYCENGVVDPYNYAKANGDYDAIFSATYDGLTAEKACCACGGGVKVNTLSESLVEWKIVVFGHGVGGSESGPSTPSPVQPETEPPSIIDNITATIEPTDNSSFFALFTSSPSGPPSLAEPDIELPPVLDPVFAGSNLGSIDANGDNYFYKETYITNEQYGNEETILVRNAPDDNLFIPSAFALISFPLNNPESPWTHSVTNRAVNKDLLQVNLCLVHENNTDPEATPLSQYTVCRISPSSIITDSLDVTSIDLDTLTPESVSQLIMPDSCVGEKGSNVVEFNVSSPGSNDKICMDVTNLLITTELTTPEKRKLRPMLHEEEGIAIFMIDNFGPEQTVGDRFYTSEAGAGRSPELVLLEVPKTRPPSNTTNAPTASVVTVTIPQTLSPTNGTQSPAPIPLDSSDNQVNLNGLYGLLVLLVLIPIVVIWKRDKRRQEDGTTQEDTIEEGIETTAKDDGDSSDDDNNFHFDDQLEEEFNNMFVDESDTSTG